MLLRNSFSTGDTICALSTSPGIGAIAVIRLSGPEAFAIGSKYFRQKKAKAAIESFDSHTAHFGYFQAEDELIDEVVVTVFRGPNSYTGEDVLEISCHGSLYIQQRVLEVLLSGGARMAERGEFTFRAFRNGRFDLSQAEAVADLIASETRASHDLALKQMRGGFSQKIKLLRQQLVDLASLLELELDFSEEDVEFADRDKFNSLITSITSELESLESSFATGNVIKKGIPVAIIGKPNVGKSTLLNALLNEERAIVSEIPGTTRDAIEDTLTIQGTTIRFIDTAGLRAHTTDTIETIGISRTYEKMKEASVILYLFDISTITVEEIEDLRTEFRDHIDDPGKHFILVGNKTDLMIEAPPHVSALFDLETLFISAKRKENINLLIESILKTVQAENLTDQTIVSNARHHEAIIRTLDSLKDAQCGFSSGLATDLIATDIRSALYHLGTVTGEISSNEILSNIFQNFCIGK